MDTTELQRLAAKLDELLEHHQLLKAQNRLLLANEKAWREERAQLIEKNELARQKVEAMISRLKALEQDS
jgi:cell division protein ZapB